MSKDLVPFEQQTDQLSGVIEGADIEAKQTTRTIAAQLARDLLADINASRHTDSSQPIEAAQEKAAKLVAYLEGEAE